MKIIIDSAIPFIEGLLEPYCRVEYLDGGSITPQAVQDADALIIRTRTRCNAELLEGSAVRHIATATIGFDHIDMEYCRSRNIEVSRAAGCNARAVLQWVAATLAHLSREEGWNPSQRRLGVVGVGNVGSLVAQYAHLWGFEVLCCDPPREEREGGDFISLEQLCAKADIITMHTPLDSTTYHAIGAKMLEIIKPTTTIINSSRGEVVDTEALLKSGHKFVMDVWEGEPHINPIALERAMLATPHIAGYSRQGKSNATEMVVRSTANFFALPIANYQSFDKRVSPREIGWEEMCQTIVNEFDIVAQSEHLKRHASLFESMRNNYNYRNEYF